MRVAITGVAGFVGRALGVRFRELGWTVHGYDLAPSREQGGPGAHGHGGEVRRWDVGAGPLRAAPPVDAVVHAAARLTGGLAESRRVNVGGTANVAWTFPEARLVHVSSCSVYDPWRPQVNAAEHEAPEPDSIRWTNAYGRTKAEAERWLAAERPDAVRLRPHAVYGQGDTTLLPRVRRAVRRGVLPVPGTGTQLHSVTWVQNLVEACRLACVADVSGGAYNIADEQPVLLAEVMALLAAGPGGSPPRIRPIPIAALLPLAVAGEAAALARTALTGRAREPRISRYNVEHLGRERTFDLTRARDLLGYRPEPSRFLETGSW